jgi:hypothetical protein
MDTGRKLTKSRNVHKPNFSFTADRSNENKFHITSHIIIEKEDLDLNEESDPYQERTTTGSIEDTESDLMLCFKLILPDILKEYPYLGEPSI